MARSAESPQRMSSPLDSVKRLWILPSTVMVSELDVLVAGLRTIAAGAEARQVKGRRAAAAIARVGGYRWVGVYDIGATEIGVLGWAGPSAPAYPTFPRSQGLNGVAVAAGEPVIVQDVSQDHRYLSTLGSTRAEMIMPVRAKLGGAVVGTIDVESDRVNPFTEWDCVLLSACAEALIDLWSGAV
jgi:L-methionine (R)-S-oxide reductase